jgi:hypothetical protein
MATSVVEHLAARTQYFSDSYIVRWLLQNSLGRSYHEAYPDSKLPERWEYYIDQPTPAGLLRIYPLHVLELLEPCCGSGNFLCEAFDMFVAMYQEQHPDWSAAAIAERVLERHLYGMDIDPLVVEEAQERLFNQAACFAGTTALPAPNIVALPDMLGSLRRPTLFEPIHPCLERQYAVVVTNPPYMTSGKMPVLLKEYLERHYEFGKRDLCTAFIQRCLELCSQGGRVAMITQQSWMFLRSFTELRRDLLRTVTLETLGHLGDKAFAEIGGGVVATAMFVFGNSTPDPEHRMTAIRLVGLPSPDEKARVLRDVARSLKESL